VVVSGHHHSGGLDVDHQLGFTHIWLPMGSFACGRLMVATATLPRWLGRWGMVTGIAPGVHPDGLAVRHHLAALPLVLAVAADHKRAVGPQARHRGHNERVSEERWRFDAELWSSESFAAWAFLTLPAEVGDDVRLLSGPPTGFGSVRVEVTLGSSTWRTSVFPDKVRGYVLPVKADVRRRERLELGDRVALTLLLVPQE